MPRHLTFVLLLIVSWVPACTDRAAPPTSTARPVSTTTAEPIVETTTSSTPSAQAEIRSCDDATDDPLALICRGYELIQENYVDPVEPAPLAEGALAGLTREVPDDQAGGEPLVCEVPDPSFSDFCQAYALRLDESADDDLTAAALQGMIDRGLGDPYSAYLNPEMYEQFQEEQTGRIQGIGAFVGVTNLDDPEDLSACTELSDKCILEMTPIAGTPADQAGLEAGDRLISVNGEPVEASTLEEVVSKVRGPAGTDVTLGILRNGERLELTITRGVIEVPVLETRMETDDIGYLRLFAFTTGSHEELRQALGDLIDQGAQRLIFDLRDNPGGSLNEAIRIADEFIAEGIVLHENYPGTGPRPIDSEPGGLWADQELVVLINGGSASASEIVAAALQEGGRAVLVGEPTFGKNTVQQTYRLDGEGALKLTVARWLTPDQTDFAGTGIQPDVEVPSDQALDRALEILAT